MFNLLYKLISTPFGYVMRWIFQLVGSYGWSVVLFSLLTKVLTLPLTLKQKRDMMAMQAIQPKVLAIRKTFGKDPQRMNEELQNLYDVEGVSPSSGCGSTLLILPIMIGLYGVISQPLTYFMQLTENEISTIASRLGYAMSGAGYTQQIGLAGAIHDSFAKVADISSKLLKVDFRFGPFDLAAVPTFKGSGLMWLIPILSGLTALGMSFLTQYFQRKTNPASADAGAQTNWLLFLMSPLMSLWFAFKLPAGLGLYWIASNVFTALQEAIINMVLMRKKNEE